VSGLTRNIVTLSSRRTPGQNTRGYFRVGAPSRCCRVYENISREREAPSGIPSPFRTPRTCSRACHRFFNRTLVASRRRCIPSLEGGRGGEGMGGAGKRKRGKPRRLRGI